MAKDKITPITGFPEWLPHQRMVEQHILDRIRASFELWGFAPIETPAVERLAHLASKGADADKEIYALRRLAAGEGDDSAELGLHFDLTVPFARYVKQHRQDLQFPMRRYQIQKVWRGEKPQKGRFREFYQADVDVIAMNQLGLHYDAEMTVLLHETLARLPIPEVTIRINNRKVLEGFYRALGVEDTASVLRVVDKLDKIGADKTRAMLKDTLGFSEAHAAQCLALAEIRAEDASVVDQVKALGERHPLLDEGLDELARVMDAVQILPRGSVVADLHIARGLDYYTGTVYEGTMRGHEKLGSVCSGGRYDDLASIEGVKLPGIGVSIGVTRIVSALFEKNAVRGSRHTPSCVLVALISEEERHVSNAVARELRKRDIPCEVFERAVPYGRQIQYADAKGIPFVWFPNAGGTSEHKVRDLRAKTETVAEASSWRPDDSDLRVGIVDGSVSVSGSGGAATK